MSEAVHLDPSWFVWPGLPDDGPVSLVVLGDSTSFTDHRGPQLPTEPGLYPNVAAARLSTLLDREVAPTVLARPGWTVRDAHRATTKDRHVMFDVLARAHAVVIGVGSFDHAPGGIPAPIDAVVPYLRPATVRRRVRRRSRSRGREHVEAFEDDLNPDGIHWHTKGHEAVGIAIAEALHPMLTGAAPAPGVPGAPE